MSSQPRMSPQMLAEFKEILLERQRTLAEQAQHTRDEFEENRDMPADPNDKASEEHDHAFELRIRGRENKLIHKVREALQRIEDGTFGVCRSCGELIQPARLRARPVADLCIACKEEQELLEKMN